MHWAGLRQGFATMLLSPTRIIPTQELLLSYTKLREPNVEISYPELPEIIVEEGHLVPPKPGIYFVTICLTNLEPFRIENYWATFPIEAGETYEVQRLEGFYLPNRIQIADSVKQVPFVVNLAPQTLRCFAFMIGDGQISIAPVLKRVK